MVINNTLKDNKVKPLRIAFIINGFPVVSETFILDQITSLLDLGQDVDIYAVKKMAGDYHDEVKRYNLLARTRFVASPKNKTGKLLEAGNQVLRTAIKHPSAFWRALREQGWAELLAGPGILRHMESLGGDEVPYDIIHCHYGTIGRHFLLLKRVLSTKYVVSFHGHDLFYYNPRGKQAYRSLFSIADRLVAHSNYTVNNLVSLGCPAAKIVNLPLGVRSENLTFRPRTLAPGIAIQILTVARLVEFKGLEYSIKAVARLAPRYSIQYNIVGEGEERPRLESLIRQLDLSGSVKLLGARTREEVAELMDEAHLFVLPSVTDRKGLTESGGISVREAQASGIPVVASNTGGIPEGVADGVSGFLVPERDVDALAEKLEFLITHPDLWPAMGKAGRRFMDERFDLRRQNEKLLEFYRDLAGWPGPGIRA